MSVTSKVSAPTSCAWVGSRVHFRSSEDVTLLEFTSPVDRENMRRRRKFYWIQNVSSTDFERRLHFRSFRLPCGAHGPWSGPPREPSGEVSTSTGHTWVQVPLSQLIFSQVQSHHWLHNWYSSGSVPRSSHTTHFTIGTPVATLPVPWDCGDWLARYRYFSGYPASPLGLWGLVGPVSVLQWLPCQSSGIVGTGWPGIRTPVATLPVPWDCGDWLARYPYSSGYPASPLGL